MFEKGHMILLVVEGLRHALKLTFKLKILYLLENTSQ